MNRVTDPELIKMLKEMRPHSGHPPNYNPELEARLHEEANHHLTWQQLHDNALALHGHRKRPLSIDAHDVLSASPNFHQEPH